MLSILVIMIRNRIIVQIQDEVVCVSLNANALRKGMNPSIFSPAMGN